MALRSCLRQLLPLLAPSGLAIACLCPAPLRAHGMADGNDLAPGQFQLSPVITLEGHAGLENNLEGQPRHYAIDGMVGIAMQWGLPNKGSFAIEAMLGPALVWGEAEHFYGRVHREPKEARDPRAALLQSLLQNSAQDAPADGHEHADHDHGGGDGGHAAADHDDGHGHGGGHDHAGSPFRRTDIKAQLQMRYEPNDRLALMLEWKPYFVTASQGDDIHGVKHELAVGVIWALGDGDVNFALGDGLETIADGLFLSLTNRTGWESDGTYLGNYTDAWVGLGFNIDRLNVTISTGPRFYNPGGYSGLPSRTDWGGELELTFPLSRRTVLFAHWRPIYSGQEGEGWGSGWQHHIGSGVSFRF